jgi:hypothetical protein
MRDQKVHAVMARSAFQSQNDIKSISFSAHFWTFKRCFFWQTQWILHLVEREPNVWVLEQFQKRWRMWEV